MSYPHDNSSHHRSRHSTTSASEDANLAHVPYSPQPRLEQQSNAQAYGYTTPQRPQVLPLFSRSGSQQTSAHFSSSHISQNESLWSTPDTPKFSDNTADTTLSNPSSPLAGSDVFVVHRYNRQPIQSQYGTDMSYGTEIYEAQQSSPVRERRQSVSNNTQLPSTGRDSHGGSHHRSNGYPSGPSGSGSRKHQDYLVLDFPVFEEDEVMLDGDRNLQSQPDLQPMPVYTHQLRPTLAGVGDRFDDQRHSQSAIRRADADLRIYGNSIEDSLGYANPEILSRSPESLASSMASLMVNNGSASGSRDDYTGQQQQQRHPSNGGSHRSSHDRRRPSSSRHKGDRSANVDGREPSQKNTHYPPAPSRAQMPPQSVPWSESMPSSSMQTSSYDQASGQQVPPATMGLQRSPISPSAAISGYNQQTQQGIPFGNTADQSMYQGDGYSQYTWENGTYNHQYWLPRDGRSNDTSSRYPPN
ncbi:hypothetical protein VP1G_06222 [Cytospora mali]|uniref:Uncharacterized protein n=1 Tax=Cytospora mali TaxID=578113 RepID=A0A194V513_CYTMA|nr:hypothetical protein VP1G_06222 [Valsa mali var. pyri (nom. inval.)]